MDKKSNDCDACSALKACKLPAGKVAVTDMDGILEENIYQKEVIERFKGGLRFCDVILGGT